MIRAVTEWKISELYTRRDQIAFPEYQREKSLWPTDKKSKLIDSILQDIDIPKLYFNKVGDVFEVVDGQQRIWSIWEFLDNEFKYTAGSRKRLYAELAEDEKKTIQDYALQITIFENADEDYLRELFQRLQLGLLLNTGEKLNASKGEMRRFVFEQLTPHPFIQAISITEKRYAKQTLCAQICINSFRRKKLNIFARTRFEDLISFFEEYESIEGQDVDLFKERRASIVSVMDKLDTCFGEHARQLKNRSYILSVYLFSEELGDQLPKQFSEFILMLWQRLKEESALGLDRKNRELYTFQGMLSSAPGEAYQIERRHEKLRELYSYFQQYGKIAGD